MNNDDFKQRFILMLGLGLTFLVVMQYIFPSPSREARAPAPRFDPPPIVQAAASPGDPGESPGEGRDFHPDRDYTVTVRVGGEEKGGSGYEAVFSSVGAGLLQYRLLGHSRQPGNVSPENRVILVDRMAPGRDSLRVDAFFSGASRQAMAGRVLRDARFELVEAPAAAGIDPPPGPEVRLGENLTFRAVAGDWEILKTFRFPGGGVAGKPGLTAYTLAFDLEWRNLSPAGQTLSYRLAGPAGLVTDDDSPNFGAVNVLTARQPSSASPGVEIERIPLREISEKKGEMQSLDNRAGLAWLGAKNRFFTALLAVGDPSRIMDSDGAERNAFPGNPANYPRQPDILAAFKSQPSGESGSGTVPLFEDTLLLVDPGMVEAGKSYSASYLFYAGPAEDSLLEAADPRFQGVVSYTISYLDFISRWLASLLTFLDNLLGNYGLAIIVITLIIKLLLHPLNRKMFVSMNKMSKLAPMMKEIQRKYAGDRARMQQEMGKFYKDNGVNMAGGCLPIFLQLPIFFALYGAFAQGFSMRHAVFIPGWIEDLSKPDSVYDLGWTIPILQSSYISLLPILYLALQLIQTSLQPTPSDPQQAQQQKIMKYMPVVFVFIFYSMPAGLVLYFTVSALCGVAENWWMRKILLPRLGLGDSPAAIANSAAQAKAGAGAAPPGAGKRKKRRR
ncbi:MAG: membrane protein insertase YidC [Planctomycetota bacterium]|nr:membrane protein insertase YidC [Planctomycetota bacterium]